MPVVTLPDGSQRSFDQAVSVADVAADVAGDRPLTTVSSAGAPCLATSHFRSSNPNASESTAALLDSAQHLPGFRWPFSNKWIEEGRPEIGLDVTNHAWWGNGRFGP